MIYSYHMGAFFVVSGYLYGLKPKSNLKKYALLDSNLISRVITMIVPLLVAVFVRMIMIFIKGEKVFSFGEIIGAGITAVNNYWFLPAMALVCILYRVLQSFVEPLTETLIFIALWMLISYFANEPGKFIGYTLLYSAGAYFSKKENAHNKKIQEGNKGIYKLAAVIFLCIILYTSAIYINIFLKVPNTNSYIKILTSLPFSLLALMIAPKILNYRRGELLRLIGKSSIYIYVIHGTIILLLRNKERLIPVLFGNDLISLAIYTAICLVVPIVLYLLSTKAKWLDFIFAPMKYISKTQLWSALSKKLDKLKIS